MPLSNNSSLKATIDGFENLKNVVNNNRIALRDKLDSKNIEVSEDERLSSLINKVDNIGAIDIITASKLPISGRENQICVITDINPPNIYVTPNTTDAYTKDNNVRLFISDDYRTAKGELSITSGKIISDYHFDRAMQNAKGLYAYNYANGSWNELLKATAIAFDFGSSDLGVSTGGQQVLNPNTNNIQLYFSSYLWISLCFQQLIDFSNYTTCEITFTGGDSTSNSSHNIYVMNSNISTSSMGSSLAQFKYSEVTQPTRVSLAGVSEGTPKTVAIDISSLNGMGYLGIIDNYSKIVYTTTNISKIIMY